MALAVDASAPSLVSSAASTQTTGSFSPPASLLVACVMFEAASAPSSTITMSSTGTTLTWSLQVRRDANDSGGKDGIAAIYTAPTAAQTGITVTALSGKASDAGGLKVLVITGMDTSSPVGATGEGSSSTTDITPTVYTSTVPESRAIGCASNFSGQGNPISSDTGFGFLIASRVGGLAVHKASNTVSPSTGVTLNMNNNGGISTQWNWVAVEIKPPIPALPPRPLMLGQAVNRAAYF